MFSPVSYRTRLITATSDHFLMSLHELSYSSQFLRASWIQHCSSRLFLSLLRTNPTISIRFLAICALSNPDLFYQSGEHEGRLEEDYGRLWHTFRIVKRCSACFSDTSALGLLHRLQLDLPVGFKLSYAFRFSPGGIRLRKQIAYAVRYMCSSWPSISIGKQTVQESKL